MKRAFIFTMDAIMALVPVFIIVGAVSTLSAGESILLRGQFVGLHYAASDLAAVSEKSGYIDDMGEMFTNYTDLKKDGDTQWTTERNNLLDYINETLLPLVSEHRGFAVEFWGVYQNGTSYLDVEYTTDNRTMTGQARPYEDESATTLASVKLATGYEKDVPLVGYVARAWIDRVEWRTTEFLFGWQRVLTADNCGSSSCGNNLNTTMRLDLPSDYTPSNCNYAWSRVLSRVGGGWQDIDVWINGVLRGSDGSNGVVNINNICNYLNNGSNNITVRIDNDGGYYEIGTGSGTMTVVNLNSSESTSLVNTRFYTNEIASSCAIKQQMSLFTPGTINSMAVHLEVTNVDSVTLALARGANVDDLVTVSGLTLAGDTVDITDAQIVSALAGLSPPLTYADLSPRVYNLNIYFDISSASYESPPEIYRPPCGTQRARTVSNNSYIAVNWVPPTALPSYYVDITKALALNGINSIGSGYYEAMTGTYDLVEEVTPWGVDIWLAWRLTDSTPDSQEFSENGITLYSAPPDPFDAFVVRYAYTQQSGVMVQPWTNVFRAQGYSSGGGDYGFSPTYSYGTVTYILITYVPFGETFSDPGTGFNISVYYDGDQDGYYNLSNPRDGSQEIMVGGGGPLITFCGLDPNNEALEDAFLRLMDNLNFANDSNNGDYGSTCSSGSNSYDGTEYNPVDLVIEPDVKIESHDISGVPFMWGPIRMRFRVWE